jgi:alpha-glutamyl/putrescinyl thymine pyrophosphorylase clade 1
MLAEYGSSEPRVSELSFWINERYRIKERVSQGQPAPWTEDPILQSVRFCNVHREDDKVTRWLAENWRPTYHEVWHILMARLFNNIPTLQVILFALDRGDELKAIKHLLKVRRDDLNKVIFGNAYTVSTSGRPMDKLDYVFDLVLPLAKSKQIDMSSLKAAADDMCLKLLGVSTFMAGQLVADLKNTAGHPLSLAQDWRTWAAPGPGSLRGLTAFWGRTITPALFTKSINECWQLVQPHLIDMPLIHMQDFQNCMCEFSKYMKVKHGGHARNSYPGKG